MKKSQSDTVNEIKDVLINDDRLTSSDGQLLKNKTAELARKNDNGLVELLLDNEVTKSRFFKEVAKATIFDKDAFIDFIYNKNFLPDSYTKFSQNVGLTFGDAGDQLKNTKDVVLSWPYKDCVLEGGQTKEDLKREEIFWNETLAGDEITRLTEPKVLTNWKRTDEDGESEVCELAEKDGGILDENLVLQGNNLLALHSIKDRFAGKVNLIYIDPPYYFASDKSEDTFLYNSNFKLSTWLTFMKNRLEVAKELLADGGAIFVQINDDGVAELHRLLKETFGQDNFINKITVKTRSPSGFASVNPGVFESAEYILSFAKNKKNWKYNEQYVKSDYDRNYKWFVPNKDEETYENWEVRDLFEYIAVDKGYKNKREAINELGKEPFYQIVSEFALENPNSVFRPTEINDDAAAETVKVRDKSRNNPDRIYHIQRDDYYDIYVQNGREMAFYSKKVRQVDGELAPSIQVSNIWTDVPYEGISKEGDVTLKGGKKPEKLLKRIIAMASDPGDIVLDFFSGTGTTAAVAHKMGRHWVSIEQLSSQIDKQTKRMKNVIDGDQSGVSKAVEWEGGGSFVSAKLLEWNKQWQKKIKSATKDELKSIWKEIKKKAHLSWRVDLEKIDEEARTFEDLNKPEMKKFLNDVLDKNHLYVNYPDMDDGTYDVSDKDKNLNNKFYD